MKNEKHYLETISWGVIPVVNYRGVEVWKLKNGYKVFSQTVVSAEEVDGVIDGAGKSLENSISDISAQKT